MTNKKQTDKELGEMAYNKKLGLIQSKNDYISNLTNARYFLERYNMMAEQIQIGKIIEKIDGCPKTMNYMLAEAAVIKRQALASFRSAHFGQLDMKKLYNLTDKDIKEIESDLYDGKIIRETYDEEYKKGNKAEFVNKQ